MTSLRSASVSARRDGLKKVYRLLSLNLGVPPTSFTYTLKDKDGKAISTETYTPQSFYERFVGADLRGQFVMLMNDPSSSLLQGL